MKHLTAEDAQAAWQEHIKRSIVMRLRMIDGIKSTKDMALTRHVLSIDSADSFISFVNDWCWTYDPRSKNSKQMPFVLWDRQEEIARALWETEKNGGFLMVAKSRDTGITWLVSAYAVWRWLFKDGWTGAFGSRNEATLDSAGDPSSLFWKMLFIIDNLPEWLAPVGFNERKHRKDKQILNPENGSVIVGNVGANMGRGGRSSMYFMDEFAAIEHGQAVEAAVSGNTESIVAITTTTPPGTYAHQVHERDSVRVENISWMDDPRKDVGFLNRYIQLHSPELAKREYEISWDGDNSSQFIPANWLRSAVTSKPIDTDYHTQAGLDVAAGGDNNSVLVIRKGSRVVGVWKWSGIDPTTLVNYVVPICVANTVSTLVFDETGVGAGVGGALRNMGKRVTFQFVGVNNGESPSSGPMYDDGFKKPCSERFANKKAQQWWEIRLRAKHTQEYVDTGTAHEKMLFIPASEHTEELIKELATPSFELDSRNRVAVEGKKSLSRRSVKSPDFADAAVLAFSEQTKVLMQWV